MTDGHPLSNSTLHVMLLTGTLLNSIDVDLQAMGRYRREFGLEPIRRCIVCGKGEGERIRKCERCLEAYCSRECQMKDWEAGHKAVCQTHRFRAKQRAINGECETR